jgi:predicted cupin superfamily sugar epimerase
VPANGPDPDEIIAALGLTPHPEGGWYAETWRAGAPEGQRPAGTAIYFLLKAGETSHWHRVDAAEVWLWHAGAALLLDIAETEAGPARRHRLGPDLSRGERPQAVVSAHHWQAARSTGAFTLVSCVVAPGFTFEGFELAPKGFDIPPAGTDRNGPGAQNR